MTIGTESTSTQAFDGIITICFIDAEGNRIPQATGAISGEALQRGINGIL